jgi:aspartate-semialdehyde dehydrogenase
VEFENPPEFETLTDALSMPGIEVVGADFDPPNNVGQAGQSGISVGAISPDRNDPMACWFWFVADNLRLQAENAVAVAMELA